MRRLASFSSAVLALVTLATLDSAASAAEPRQQFIDMGITNITGEVKTPGAAYFNHRKAAIFARMLKLRKEMLPNIEKTLQDPALK